MKGGNWEGKMGKENSLEFYCFLEVFLLEETCGGGLEVSNMWIFVDILSYTSSGWIVIFMQNIGEICLYISMDIEGKETEKKRMERKEKM